MGRNKLSRFHIFYRYFVPNGTDFHLSKTHSAQRTAKSSNHLPESKAHLEKFLAAKTDKEKDLPKTWRQRREILF
jgi:hypothetical protein